MNKLNKYIFRKQVMRGAIISLTLFTGISVLMEPEIILSPLTLKESSIDIETERLLGEVELLTGIETNNNKNLVLLHAVLNNNNLTESEKNYFYNLKDIICENKYIDLVDSYDRLFNLTVIYTKRPGYYDDTVIAIYDNTNNKIIVFENEDKFNEEIFEHELIHALFTNKTNIKLPKFFLEGVTELLTNEYFSENTYVENKTYPFEIAIVKILCEMIGSDEILKTYTTGNTETFYDKLSEFNQDGEKFIKNLDTIYKAFSRNKEIPTDEYNEAIVFMDNFYKNKYSGDLEKQETYNYYKKIINMIHLEKPFDEYQKYIYENGVFVKPYFSEKLKEKSTNNLNSDNYKKMLKKSHK